jgi:hypothetical protein
MVHPQESSGSKMCSPAIWVVGRGVGSLLAPTSPARSAFVSRILFDESVATRLGVSVTKSTLGYELRHAFMSDH